MATFFIDLCLSDGQLTLHLNSHACGIRAGQKNNIVFIRQHDHGFLIEFGALLHYNFGWSSIADSRFWLMGTSSTGKGVTALFRYPDYHRPYHYFLSILNRLWSGQFICNGAEPIPALSHANEWKRVFSRICYSMPVLFRWSVGIFLFVSQFKSNAAFLFCWPILFRWVFALWN
jgi:hypothetical protein